MGTCICVAESLCCPPGTITILFYIYNLYLFSAVLGPLCREGFSLAAAAGAPL